MTFPQARYQIFLSINEEEYLQVEELRKKNIKLINIFRKGLRVTVEEFKKEETNEQQSVL